ncbi:hypothetical protein VKT23_015535 [Stygiomarasmius scandens]|uniref:Uncharacterized protein n=1 Tax=Marasmiellus scandens TaxID=2682957 RepID=A0ABR1J1R8_9AGAR
MVRSLMKVLSRRADDNMSSLRNKFIAGSVAGAIGILFIVSLLLYYFLWYRPRRLRLQNRDRLRTPPGPSRRGSAISAISAHPENGINTHGAKKEPMNNDSNDTDTKPEMSERQGMSGGVTTPSAAIPPSALTRPSSVVDTPSRSSFHSSTDVGSSRSSTSSGEGVPVPVPSPDLSRPSSYASFKMNRNTNGGLRPGGPRGPLPNGRSGSSKRPISTYGNGHGERRPSPLNPSCRSNEPLSPIEEVKTPSTIATRASWLSVALPSRVQSMLLPMRRQDATIQEVRRSQVLG